MCVTIDKIAGKKWFYSQNIFVSDKPTRK